MTTDPPGVGVVGAGRLGSTVVRAALAAGSPVTVVVRGGAPRCRQRAAELADGVSRDVARGHLTAAEADRLIRRARFTDRLTDLAGVDVVIESVPESVELKRAVIGSIEDVVAPDTVIASTTSSIPAGVLARGARHPERVVVAHYVWPAHRMPLVEVAFHPGTAVVAAARIDGMLRGQGKRQIRVADRPGFLITRALFAYWNAAAELLCEGCAPGAVDDALADFGWPMGPFAVMEGTGLSSVARIHADLAPHLGSPFPALAALTAAFDAGAVRIRAPLRGLDGHLAELLGVRYLLPVEPDDVVERTVGALAEEVDRAVAERVVGSWDEAGSAIDAAYGFPRKHGGLAQWSRDGLHRGRQTVMASTPDAVGTTDAGSREGERA